MLGKMDNVTIGGLFPTMDVMGIGHQVADTSATTPPYPWHTSNTSSPQVSNSTRTPWVPPNTVELSVVALWVYLAVRILWAILAIFGMSQLNYIFSLISQN